MLAPFRPCARHSPSVPALHRPDIMVRSSRLAKQDHRAPPRPRESTGLPLLLSSYPWDLTGSWAGGVGAGVGRMPSLLIAGADVLASMDDADTVWRAAGLYAVDGVIRQVGPTAELPTEADERIDARGMMVLPGLVNTHHHFFQALTRCTPAAQDAELFDWLTTHYPIWARLTPEAIYVSTQGRHRRADALRLHDDERPHLPLAERRAPRRPDRGGVRRWACAFTPRAARCRSANRAAACRRTAWSRTRRRSCATRGGRSSSTMTPPVTRCCGSSSPHARPSRCRPT